MFESTEEDIRTVILYGVPGVPSISFSSSATYTKIRSMIAQTAPNLRNFYFVAHGRIIKIEDTVVDWGPGHFVLNVHTFRDLPGGSMQSSSDDDRRVRNLNRPCNFQRLLLSDVSDEDDFDGTISLRVSESESIQDSDSFWDL